MKIALIQCPVWGTYDPPLALAQLSACLKKAYHKVFVFDMNIGLYNKRTENYKNMWAWEQSDFWHNPEYVRKFFLDKSSEINCYLERTLKNDIRIVGFSVNSGSRLASMEFAKRLKECNRNIIVVFGGPLFLNKDFIKEVLKEEFVDIVIPGEGEVAFCELINSLDKEKDISGIPGIVFSRNGHFVGTKPTGLMDLDSLSFLDFSDLPLSNYDDSEHIPFMASRGCIKRCVFCSDAPCWPGYRAMSGERIFREIAFHKSKYKNSLGHIDFMDLVFNGNMASLERFCDLMIEADLNVYWTANMIIRPEMNIDVINKMAKAKCEHIIFGIESGSPKVLQLMNKHHRIEDADRIIRQMHEAGICVTCNFMFGFPGEMEEDFQLTLDFIKRNAKYLDRVYPSRTYCALEEFSYLNTHLEEFGIRPNPPNHLYWETIDGKNAYPERLRRCEEFCKLALSLGIEVGSGVQTSVELDRWFNLSNYYETIKDYEKAIECYKKYMEIDPHNEVVLNKIKLYTSNTEVLSSGR